MKLNKKVKKILAYICAITMVVTSITVYQAKAADTELPEGMTEIVDGTSYDTTAWTFYMGGASGTAGKGSFKGGATLTDPFDLYIEQTSGTEWGIQITAPEITGLTAGTKYQYTLKFTASKAGGFYTKENLSNSNKTSQKYVEGENTVTGTFTAGEKASILIDMLGVESDTLFHFTEVSVTDKFEEETTEKPTADAEGYFSSIEGEWTTEPSWQVFASAGNSMKFKAGTINDTTIGLDLKMITNSGADWQTQAKVPAETKLFGPLKTNDTVYTVDFTYTSNKAGSLVFQINGDHNDAMTIEEGTHTISFEYTSKVDYPVVFMNLAGIPSETDLVFEAKFTEKNVETDPAETESESESETESESVSESVSESESESVSESVSESESESESVSESESESESETESESVSESVSESESQSESESTPDVTTPVASTPVVTTPAGTTKVTPTTTTAPKATKKALAKTKITKVPSKKLSAKKVKITFKKVKGAKKYQVQISTSKKFKKILVKKTVKKVKVTITKKVLANKKKLYVRVRAVGAKKWSVVKMIKIKK